MNNALATINAVASWIPSKIRGVIYVLIGLVSLVDDIWHFIPDGDIGSKITATIKLLALIMAVVNTDLVPNPEPPAPDDGDDEGGDAGESTLATILIVLLIVLVVAFLLGWVRL